MGGENDAVCTLEESPYYVYRACARGLLETVEKLMKEDSARATSTDLKGWTCLHHAASRDKLPIIDLLLSFSTQTLNATNFDGDTPLHLAAKANKSNAIKHILLKGAQPNILNTKKLAPIHIATQANHNLVLKVSHHACRLLYGIGVRGCLRSCWPARGPA